MMDGNREAWGEAVSHIMLDHPVTHCLSRYADKAARNHGPVHVRCGLPSAFFLLLATSGVTPGRPGEKNCGFFWAHDYYLHAM